MRTNKTITWKIYFGAYITLFVLGLLNGFGSATGGTEDIGRLFGLLVFIFAVIGLHGFINNKKIFTKHIWYILSVIELLIFIIIIVPPTISTLFEASTISLLLQTLLVYGIVWAIYLPAIYAHFTYGKNKQIFIYNK